MELDIPAGEFAGYIFDCDGTLVHSMPLHYRAWTAAFEHHRAPYTYTEQKFYSLAGIPDLKIVEIMNAEYGGAVDPVSVKDFKEEYFIRHMHELEPVHAVADVVKQLHRRKPIAVASGSDISVVEPELRHVGLLDYFEILVTPRDVKHGKPAPDMFLLAAEKMGVSPELCLVFEDGKAGIEAANAAGMKSVFVPSGPVHR